MDFVICLLFYVWYDYKTLLLTSKNFHVVKLLVELIEFLQNDYCSCFIHSRQLSLLINVLSFHCCNSRIELVSV